MKDRIHGKQKCSLKVKIAERGHWKSRLKKKKSSIEEDDLSQPWVCEETDPFTPRIRYFDFLKKTRMPRGEVVASNKVRKKTLLAWKQQKAGQKQNFDRRGDFRISRAKTRQRKGSAESSKEGISFWEGQTYGDPNGPTMAKGIFSPDPKISFPPLGDQDGAKGPMVIEAEIGSQFIHRIYVDGGSTSEILYEHCFNRLRPEVKNQMVPATAPLIGFSGEIIWPMGKISLPVKIGDAEHLMSTWINFVMVRSPSPYNGITGRPGVTAHGMLKFLVPGGILTLPSSKIIPLECTMVSGPEAQPSAITRAAEERIKVAIHLEYPEQTIAIGFTLTEEGQKELCNLLRCNLDIFAWKPSDMSGVSRHIAEHWVNIREGCPPVRQKK
ncbi:hypothetical protein Tco_1204212 [Tanacetum coccineum]